MGIDTEQVHANNYSGKLKYKNTLDVSIFALIQGCFYEFSDISFYLEYSI